MDEYLRYLELLEKTNLTEEEKRFVSYMYHKEEMETELMYSRESED